MWSAIKAAVITLLTMLLILACLVLGPMIGVILTGLAIIVGLILLAVVLFVGIKTELEEE